MYDVRVPGGAAVLAVNASRELLPRRPSVAAGAVATEIGCAPALRGQYSPRPLPVELIEAAAACAVAQTTAGSDYEHTQRHCPAGSRVSTPHPQKAVVHRWAQAMG